MAKWSDLKKASLAASTDIAAGPAVRRRKEVEGWEEKNGDVKDWVPGRELYFGTGSGSYRISLRWL